MSEMYYADALEQYLLDITMKKYNPMTSTLE